MIWEQETVQGQAKEKELSLVRDVPLEPIGRGLAALSYWVLERRESQTRDISFARAFTV